MALSAQRRVDPRFFEKEAALLDTGAGWSGDYDVDAGVAARFAADVVGRRAAMIALALAAFSASGFGVLLLQWSWPIAVPLVVLVLSAGWMPSRVKTDTGAGPATIDQRRPILVLAIYAAWLCWPIASVLPVSDLVMPAAVSLAVAVATLLVLAGSFSRWPAACHPGLYRRLAALALVVSLVRPAGTAPFGLTSFAAADPLLAWGFTLVITLALAAGLRVARGRAFGRDLPWRLIFSVLAMHFWGMAFAPSVVTAAPWAHMASSAVEFAAIAIVGARWSAAGLESGGRHFVRISPPAIVPLFDRAHHHPLESWLE
jgi:hypothetical protein